MDVFLYLLSIHMLLPPLLTRASLLVRRVLWSPRVPRRAEMPRGALGNAPASPVCSRLAARQPWAEHAVAGMLRSCAPRRRLVQRR